MALQANLIISEGTSVSLSVAEASSLSIYTINQTVNSNAVTGLASDSLKAFVAADTGSTGAFSIEIADGQVSNVDSAKFQIDSSTGQVSLASGVTGLDFEAADSASGNNNYNFKVVYTNSDGVTFKENVSLSVGNNLNTSGASTVAVNTNTANNTPDATLTIDQLSTDMLLQAEALGMTNTDSGLTPQISVAVSVYSLLCKVLFLITLTARCHSEQLIIYLIQHVCSRQKINLW